MRNTVVLSCVDSNTLCKKICWYLMMGMRTLIDFGGCSMLLFKGGRRRPVGRPPSRRSRLCPFYWAYWGCWTYCCCW